MRRGMMAVMAALMLAGASPSLAARVWPPPNDPTWYLAPYAGWHVFDNRYGAKIHSDPTLSIRNAPTVGLRGGRMWAHGLGLELLGGFTLTELTRGGDKLASVQFGFATADLRWEPVGRLKGPFLSLGAGAGRFGYRGLDPGVYLHLPVDAKDSLDNQLPQFLIDAAAGWTIPVGDRTGIRLEARDLVWLTDNREDFNSATFHHLQFGAALTFGFGGPGRDQDQDGVSDRRDRCPGTPAGAHVNADGCPTDMDHDGVPDGLDRCADTRAGARVDATGCPVDSDADGVPDGIDRCNQPTNCPVDETGCPKDADRDGVCDEQDRCPGTPRGTAVGASGCPEDEDGDGVPDARDRCPGTPAGTRVDATGCPVTVRQASRGFDASGRIRLTGVPFAEGRDEVLPGAYFALDRAGEALAAQPDVRVEIRVTGGPGDTQALSRARADAVLRYLTRQFPDLDARRFSTAGTGTARVQKRTTPSSTALRVVDFTALNPAAIRKTPARKTPTRK